MTSATSARDTVGYDRNRNSRVRSGDIPSWWSQAQHSLGRCSVHAIMRCRDSYSVWEACSTSERLLSMVTVLA